VADWQASSGLPAGVAHKA